MNAVVDPAALDPGAYRWLIWRVARKYFPTARQRGLRKDELFAEGLVIAWQALGDFDPGRGCKPATWVAKRIRWAMMSLLTRAKKPMLPLPTFWDDLDLPDPDDALACLEHAEVAHTLLDTIPNPRTRTILRLLFGMEDGQEWTQEQVGKLFGVSTSRVGFLAKAALEKLRQEAEARGYC